MITQNSVSSETITINAPVELVWQVIVDFENYGEWNEFCPSIKGELKMGEPLEMQVDLGSGLQAQVESITCIEPGRKIVWSMENKPEDPIHADRAQILTPVDAHSCTYISVDEFGGEMCGPMIDAMGKAVEDGFNLCARNLKARAEVLYQAQQAGAQ